MRLNLLRWGLAALCVCLLTLSLNAQEIGRQVLSQNESREAWMSSDGQFVAFVGDNAEEDVCDGAIEPANSEIYLIDVLSGEIEQLTDNEVRDHAPSINEDGTRVAFLRQTSTDAYSVFVYDALFVETFQVSGTSETQSQSDTMGASQPMISGNGEVVVYEQGGDIFLALVDDLESEPTNLTNSPSVIDQYPSVSADGQQIAFSSGGDYLGANADGDQEVFAISASGKNLRQLTRNTVNDLHPMISGNGLFVAFARELAGENGPQTDVFTVATDGGSFETNLTNTLTMDEQYPNLSFDGNVVGYEIRVADNAQYGRIKRDGTEGVTLTSVPSDPINRVNVTFTKHGETAVFSSRNGSAGCREIFIAGDAPNVSPLANGGGDQTVSVGDTVQLDASGSSDPNGDTLTYQWEIVSRPEGSTAVLNDPTSATPTFVADVEGEYLINLTVNDGLNAQDADKVHIVAQAGGSTPDPEAGLSVEQVLDVNDNSIIDDDEMIEAIAFWVVGSPLPGTDNLTVGDDKILELIELWILGTPFDGTNN